MKISKIEIKDFHQFKDFNIDLTYPKGHLKEGQSLDTPGENIGCPAEENEITAFIQVLKKTSTLNDDELQVIAERFRKNK